MDPSLLREACLLADAETIGKLIAIAIPILIGVGSAILSQLKKAQGQPPAQRPPRPPAQAPAPGGGPTPADEVEEFLKRVAQRRGEKAPQKAATHQAAPPRPAAPKARPVSPAAPKEAAPRRSRPMGSDVEQHVEQALDSRKFADRAEHMTTVDRADESMSEHVRTVFEHRIGQFQTETITDDAGSISAETAAAPRVVGPLPAQQLAESLTSPDGMRQAILLGEVLRRPTHRWG